MLQHTTPTGRQYRSPTSIMYTQGSILLSIIAFTLQPQIFVVLFKQLSNRSFFQPGSTMSVIKQLVHVFENKVYVFTAVICSIPCVLLFFFFCASLCMCFFFLSVPSITLCGWLGSKYQLTLLFSVYVSSLHFLWFCVCVCVSFLCFFLSVCVYVCVCVWWMCVCVFQCMCCEKLS